MDEGVLDIVQHGGVDLPYFLVPIEIDAKVFFACPIFGDVIEFFKHLHEVFGVIRHRIDRKSDVG